MNEKKMTQEEAARIIQTAFRNRKVYKTVKKATLPFSTNELTCFSYNIIQGVEEVLSYDSNSGGDGNSGNANSESNFLSVFTKEKLKNLIKKYFVDKLEEDYSFPTGLEEKIIHTIRDLLASRKSKNIDAESIVKKIREEVESLVISHCGINIPEISKINLLKLYYALSMPCRLWQLGRNDRYHYTPFTKKEWQLFNTVLIMLGMPTDHQVKAELHNKNDLSSNAKLVHATPNSHLIQKEGVMQCVDHLIKNRYSFAHVNTPKSYGRRNFIYFNFNGRMPGFVQEHDNFEISPRVLTQRGEIYRNKWWASFSDWFNFDNQDIFSPYTFGISLEALNKIPPSLSHLNLFSLSNKGDIHSDDEKKALINLRSGSTVREVQHLAWRKKSIIYLRAKGEEIEKISRTISWRDEIFHGKDILYAAAFQLILELRLIGGNYREYILNAIEQPNIIKTTIDHLLQMEVKVAQSFNFRKFLLRENVTGNATNLTSYIKKFALFQAVENDDLFPVQNLIVHKNVFVDATDLAGRTALFFAAKLGRTAIAKWLIENGADITNTDHMEFNAFDYAVRGNHIEMVKLLLTLHHTANLSHISVRTDLKQKRQLFNANRKIKEIAEKNDFVFKQIFNYYHADEAFKKSVNEYFESFEGFEKFFDFYKKELDLAHLKEGVRSPFLIAAKLNDTYLVEFLIKNYPDYIEELFIQEVTKEEQTHLYDLIAECCPGMRYALILNLIQNNQIKNATDVLEKYSLTSDALTGIVAAAVVHDRNNTLLQLLVDKKLTVEKSTKKHKINFRFLSGFVDDSETIELLDKLNFLNHIIAKKIGRHLIVKNKFSIIETFIDKSLLSPSAAGEILALLIRKNTEETSEQELEIINKLLNLFKDHAEGLNKSYFSPAHHYKQNAIQCTLLSYLARKNFNLTKLALELGAEPASDRSMYSITGTNAFAEFINSLTDDNNVYWEEKKSLAFLLFDNGYTFNDKILLKVPTVSNKYPVFLIKSVEIFKTKPTQDYFNVEKSSTHKIIEPIDIKSCTIFDKNFREKIKNPTLYSLMLNLTLNYALERGDYSHLEVFLADMAITPQKTAFINGDTLWHIAVRESKYSLITLLTKYQIDPNFFNYQGITPFGLALQDKKDHITNLLLESGALPSLLSTKEELPAHDMQSDVLQASLINNLICAVNYHYQDIIFHLLSKVNLFNQIQDTRYAYPQMISIFEMLASVDNNAKLRDTLWEIAVNKTLENDCFNDQSALKLFRQEILKQQGALVSLIEKCINFQAFNTLNYLLVTYYRSELGFYIFMPDVTTFLPFALLNYAHLQNNQSPKTSAGEQVILTLLKHNAFVDYRFESGDSLALAKGLNLNETIIDHLQWYKNFQCFDFNNKYIHQTWLTSLIHLITENSGVFVRYTFDSQSASFLFSFNFYEIHPAQRAIIPYLLGYPGLEGKDGLRKSLILPSDLKVFLMEYPGKNLDLSPDALRATNGWEIVSLFMKRELETIFVSFFNSSYYNAKGCISPKKSQFYQDPREKDCIGLGANESINLLVPDRLRYCFSFTVKLMSFARVALVITESKLGDRLKDFILNALKMALGLVNEDIAIRNKAPQVVIEKSIYSLLDIMHSRRVNYMGILHLNDEDKIAIAERADWHRSARFGFCTAGGHCCDPYFPRYSAAVESFDEFGFKITNLSRLEIMQYANNHATVLVRPDNYRGTFKLDYQEFVAESKRWVSLYEIREKKIRLRHDASSILDYACYEAKNLTNLLLKVLSNTNDVCVNINCEGELIQKKSIKYFVGGNDFGKIIISGNVELLNKISELIQSPATVYRKQPDLLYLDNIMPACLLKLLESNSHLLQTAVLSSRQNNLPSVNLTSSFGFFPPAPPASPPPTPSSAGEAQPTISNVL